jgi:MraZ protein
MAAAEERVSTRAMRHFRSNFTNKIDTKGRVSVPASFRAILKESAFQGICCLRSLTADHAIDAYPQERLDEITETFDNLDPLSEEYRQFNFAVNAGTAEVSFDQDGRIILPEWLIAHARLSDQATFVGLGRYFQIWEPNAFQAWFEESLQAVKKHAAARAIASAGRGGAQ